jgi:hypothetical protein
MEELLKNNTMKVKILESSGWYKNYVGKEFKVGTYDIASKELRFRDQSNGWIYNNNCVITELPVSFCVKKCDDKKKWEKYVNWLNKKYYRIITHSALYPYYGSLEGDSVGQYIQFGTEIHIDDIIKHIDFYSAEPMTIESREEVKEDLTIVDGIKLEVGRSYYVRYKHSVQSNWMLCRITRITDHGHAWSDTKGGIITNGSYDIKTIEKFENKTQMKTQKLSRQGLKEIHSVACASWQGKLHNVYGARNPLEDYIELSQDEVNNMFKACTSTQLTIVSKYLKEDDGSVDVTKFKVSGKGFCDDSFYKGFCDDNFYIIRDREQGEYKSKSFLLSERFNWEIKKDSLGQLCLIPTKNK